MARSYRALISVPIAADDDLAAQAAADELALRTRDGNVELIGEVEDGSVRIKRVVHAEGLLIKQLPLDWKP